MVDRPTGLAPVPSAERVDDLPDELEAVPAVDLVADRPDELETVPAADLVADRPVDQVAVPSAALVEGRPAPLEAERVPGLSDALSAGLARPATTVAGSATAPLRPRWVRFRSFGGAIFLSPRRWAS